MRMSFLLGLDIGIGGPLRTHAITAQRKRGTGIPIVMSGAPSPLRSIASIAGRTSSVTARDRCLSHAAQAPAMDRN